MLRFPFEALSPAVPIADRLRSCLPAWQFVLEHGDKFVLSVVEHGYRFMFRTRPPSARPLSAPFHGTPEQMADLTRQLLDWQSSGVIEIDNADPSRRVSSLLFPVPKKDTVEFRWCHDDRYLNDWLKPQSVKYETIESVRYMIRRRDYLTSIDLKSAYSHIVIHPEHRHLLGFTAHGRWWRFRCLPFGVSSAPYVFTRVMRAVMRFLREQGIRLAIYLDDIVIMAASPELSRRHTQYVLDVLQGLGFVINLQKSSLEPSRTIQHLGVVIDAYRWQLTLPQSKLLAIAKDARRILRANERHELTVRMVAGLAGKLAAAAVAMPAARFRMRSLQRLVWFALRHRVGWDGRVSLSATAQRDATWCTLTKELRRCNHTPIRVVVPDAVLTTDASQTGWGAVLDVTGKHLFGAMPVRKRTALGREPDRQWVAHGRWRDDEAHWTSNMRETTAITRAFMHFRRRLLQCRSILFRTDNITAMSAINRCGSRYAHLGRAIEPVLRALLRHGIHARAIHLPGVMNEAADALSRLTPEVNEWALSPEAVAVCLESARLALPASVQPEKVMIDWFASSRHHICERYASRTPDPNATYIDAMQTRWSKEVGIWVPPFNLISKVIAKIVDDRAHGLLVVPYWPSRPWFGTVCQIMNGFEILPPGSYQSSVDRGRDPPTLMLCEV